MQWADDDDDDWADDEDEIVWDLSDPNLDHSSEAIKRSEAGDNQGAVDAFRAAVKHGRGDKATSLVSLLLLSIFLRMYIIISVITPY